ncbi:kinase-like domain-containing protein, partial [Amanita rubescens]
MFKLLARTPVIPTSLFITGVVAELTPRNVIGVGGFGYVYKGEYKTEQVALKVIYKKSHQNVSSCSTLFNTCPSLNSSFKKDFCREALVWRSLSHPHILPLLGIFEVESQLFLVSPYMKNGTLDVWRGNKQLEPGVDEIRMRISEVAEGVRYIHSEGIIHGDLRGANILLDMAFHAQIADFGLTIRADVTATRSTTPLTLRFAAPELFDDKQKSKKTHETDVYAFGCLYYEIYFNATPFAKINHHAVIWRVVNWKRPQRLDKPRMEDAEWDLVQLCW